MAHESDAQIAARTAQEQAYRDHKAPRGPAYRPIRARLLLQVDGREPVEVANFEPEQADSEHWCYRQSTYGIGVLIDVALSVEVRELLAEQLKHEDPTERNAHVADPFRGILAGITPPKEGTR